MNTPANLNQLYSKKLVGLDSYFNEMIKLYEAKKFPHVLLLSGKKGLGKFIDKIADPEDEAFEDFDDL